MSETVMTHGRETRLPPVNTLPDFKIHLETSIEAARLGVNHVLDALGPLNLGQEEMGTVELVLAEALNNVVEHAYPSIEMTGPIVINCTHLRNGLHFMISDRGNAMPDGMVPLGVRPDIAVETADLPEGGFGWFLIKDLAKDVEYHRIEGENQLRLRIAVAYTQKTH